MRFTFVQAPPTIVSSNLVSSVGSIGAAASGSITLDWDRVQSRVRLVDVHADVRTPGGAEVQVPVFVSVFGPVNVRHPGLGVRLLGTPSAWASVGGQGGWSMAAAPLGLVGRAVYSTDGQPPQCGHITAQSGGLVPCNADVPLTGKAATLAEVYSAELFDSAAGVRFIGCFRVRVPFDPAFPGFAWTTVNFCVDAVASSCPGDLNQDGQADLLDLLSFLNEWTSRLGGPASGSIADFEPDGVADLLDLLAFLSAWLPGCP